MLFHRFFFTVASPPPHTQIVEIQTEEFKEEHMKGSILVALVVALTLLTSTTVIAQVSGTNGQPLISEGGTKATSSPAYFDAFVGTSGTDICARISAAWTAVLTGGVNSAVIDARGFTGSWPCAQNPFPTNTHGKLLLGNVIITTTVTWVIPTQTEVEGIGSGGPATPAAAAWNTIIEAGMSNSAVIQMGPSTGGPWFGIAVRDLTVDCEGKAECVGIFNNSAEENSTIDHVQIWDAPAIALHVTAYNEGNPMNPAATNSGPYRHISVAYKNCTSGCTGATGIQIDGFGSSITNNVGSSSRLIRQFDDITVSGSGTGSHIATGFVIYGVSTAVVNSHVEYALTGIQVGTGSTTPCIDSTNTSITGSCDTHAVQISNVSIGTLDKVTGQNAIILGSTTSGAPVTADIVVAGIANQGTSSSTLVDNINTVTLSYSSDPFLGFYAIGHCPATGCTTQDPYPALITTSASVGWQEPATMKKVGGSFSIDHPLNPANSYLNHSFVESPDMMNIYNGSVTTDKHGLATVILPDYFEALNRDFRYQLTPVGQFAEAFVAQKVKGNRFVIKTSRPRVEVSWQVTGVRHDDYANHHRIRVEEPKPLSNR
jgi:hypothetical protein